MANTLVSNIGLTQAITQYKHLHMNYLKITARPEDSPKIKAEFQFRYYEENEQTGKRQYANLEDSGAVISWNTGDLEKYAVEKAAAGKTDIAQKISAVILAVQNAAAAIMTEDRSEQAGSVGVE